MFITATHLILGITDNCLTNLQGPMCPEVFASGVTSRGRMFLATRCIAISSSVYVITSHVMSYPDFSFSDDLLMSSNVRKGYS